MEEPSATRYWCHMCTQTVNPVMEVEIKCPLCHGGFIEETTDNQETDPEIDPHRALSLWAPILLAMIGNPPISHNDNDNDNNDATEESELDREIDSIIRRRRSNSATILQLLQGARGPGIDSILQDLAENDPSMLGTPPARREAIEALPAVRVSESLQCAVCLDDLEEGAEAKEMPCAHKFHPGCIIRWLEVHGSCPVCRRRLPAEEAKREPGAPARESVDGNGRRFTLPWPFAGSASRSGES